MTYKFLKQERKAVLSSSAVGWDREEEDSMNIGDDVKSSHSLPPLFMIYPAYQLVTISCCKRTWLAFMHRQGI